MLLGKEVYYKHFAVPSKPWVTTLDSIAESASESPWTKFGKYCNICSQHQVFTEMIKVGQWKWLH